jgi:NAD(P)H-dependent FMN reductase
VSEVRFLVMSGSTRTASFNQRLALVAGQQLRDAGVETTDVDLAALDLPIYHADLEAACMPRGARRLRDLFAAHDGLLLATPEYNGLPTPLLINALDWATRPGAEQGAPAGIAALTGTVAGLLSASPGVHGGLRSLLSTRQFLQMNLGMIVVPEQFGLASAGQAFDGASQLVDAKAREAVARVVHAAIRTARALKRAS